MEIISRFTSFEYISVLYAVSFFVVSIATFIAVRSVTASAYMHHRIALITTGICLVGTNVFLGSILAHSLTKVPEIQSVSPQDKSVIPIQKPEITITFKTPVQFSTLKAYSFPENTIDIVPHGGLYARAGFGRTVSLVPRQSFPPGEPITVYLANIEGPLTHGYGGEKDLQFTSESLPTVAGAESGETITDVPSRYEIRFSLTDAATEFSTWFAELSPSVPVTVSASDHEVRILPVTDYEQGTTYALTLYQTGKIMRYADNSAISLLEPRKEKTISFSVVRAPNIENILPRGNAVNPTDTIVIRFMEPMNPDSVNENITITPATHTSMSWSPDFRELQIRHDPLTKGTAYTVSILNGTKTKAGGTLMQPIVHGFTTAGILTLTASNPADGSVSHEPAMPLRFTFNQPVLSSSFLKKFSISPPVTGTSSISGSLVTFTPDTPFAPDTVYRITISSGTESQYGLPSVSDSHISFSTKPDQVSLNVPFFRQETNFTCNIAAARMLLAYKGITVTERELTGAAGNGGKRGTGNPYTGYIDDYGTYWDAVSRAVRTYSPNRIIRNGTLSDIVDVLKQGTPVMIWGQNGWSDPHDISWTSTDGTFIQAVNGMHSAVIRGYTGPPANPVTILLNDPWRGQYAIPTAEFLRRWNFFNVALVLE